ncbi:MAG: calcium-transporting P-type ATPase, PMR1-type [Candidatus Omnitrophica bacterium]|nr:calcium-transporting P-type ATPase, PMR1-type [Candidatus Omnitrophota bacterium]
MSEAMYAKTVDETVAAFKTDAAQGLAQDEARERLSRYGANQLKEEKPPSPFELFFEQFKDFIIWVLIGAAVVSGFLQEWVDALAIIAIVILNAVLGFVQEYRAEKSLAALRKLSSPQSKVIRGGSRMVIPSVDIVPGDLIEAEAGDNIPADGRLVWATANFSVQEASLTGESTPVMKAITALREKDIPLADRANMVYMGTSVSAGKARAIVAETGMNTELGKIAGMVQSIDHESTPLQKKLEEFGKWIVYACFILVGMVFLLEWLRGGKIIDVFLTAVSLAVAAIPEGLPAVVTIALALGVHRMVKRHALIRKLPSVETLGCATVICSDKTGTLSKNEMTVQAVVSGGNLFQVSGVGYSPEGDFTINNEKKDPRDFPDLGTMLAAGVLCNASELVESPGGYKIIGDPTEGALLTLAAKAGLTKNKLEAAYPFLTEIPFDSERKKMTVIRRHENRYTAFVKGAPDILLHNCSRIEKNGIVEELTETAKDSIQKANNELTGRAMRVLALAYRRFDTLPEVQDSATIEQDLTFLGLAAMIDPPREEVKDAIKECNSAGIRTVMITGDHKNTAVAIARHLGFFPEGSAALTGEELDALNDEELAARVESIPVYARVSPEHKLRIVRAWRSRGEVVAMTGDGVNDAPAVKEADIGVAMGITGTDVTKEVSDMVVTDDNFASIVAAVEEGRGIYDNIKKFVHYLLSCNVGEIMVMFVASLIGMPVPLLPIHILWVNLVTDGLPALALGVDPVDPYIMKRRPRSPHEPVVTKEMAIIMLLQGAFIALCSLGAFCLVYYIEEEGIARARTAAFVVLSCSQLFHAFNCRSMKVSLFRLGVVTNPQLVVATGISFLLSMMVVYVPFFKTVFKTEPLGLADWVLVVGISSLPLWAMEVIKLFHQSKNSPTLPLFNKEGDNT